MGFETLRIEKRDRIATLTLNRPERHNAFNLAMARELVLTARVIPAAEAAEIGLVSRVVPAASLLDEARAVARAMMECRPEVLAAAKTALRQGAATSMAESMHNEREASAKLRAALRR
jgi:enoyl-CoA hydratase/carnithine racemase